MRLLTFLLSLLLITIVIQIYPHGYYKIKFEVWGKQLNSICQGPPLKYVCGQS